MGPVEGMYGSTREEGKSWRLNFEHSLAVSVCSGHLLHPSIPTSRSKDVADFGTGTGVWLENLYSDRSRTGEIQDGQRFDGFDTSSARFPRQGKCHYEVHDLLGTFAPEFHGRYDVVHVRNLAPSLKSGHYARVANNLMDLLKPGGYIQWEELDYANMTTNPPSRTHDEMLKTITNYLRSRDISVASSCDVYAALKAVGFESVSREERNSYWETGLTHGVRRWSYAFFKRFTARALLWAGIAHDRDAADVMAAGNLDHLDEEYQEGAVVNFPCRVMLGRKSVCDV